MFDKVFEIFRDTLLEGNVVPASIYEAKKLLRDLGLGMGTSTPVRMIAYFFGRRMLTWRSVLNVGSQGIRSMMAM